MIKFFKNVHLASMDMVKELNRQKYVGFITYPAWFIAIFICCLSSKSYGKVVLGKKDAK